MITSIYIDNLEGVVSPVTISTIANNKIKRNNDYYLADESTKILKTIGLIGYNGSGKTSFIRAIKSIKSFIQFPFRKSEDTTNKFKEFIRNNFSDQSSFQELIEKFNTLELYGQNINRQDDNTTIILEMYANNDNNQKNYKSGFYTYTLIYDKNYATKGVLNEKLEYRKFYKQSDKFLIFSSNNLIESEIGLTNLYKNNQSTNFYNIPDDTFVYYKTFYDLVMNIEINPFYSDEDLVSAYKENRNDFFNLCRILDRKITNIKVETDDNDNEELMFQINSKNYLPFQMLSLGTKKFINYFIGFLNAIKLQSIVFVDEIENSLHPSLANFLINFIKYKSKDSCSQLFFTSHSPFITFNLFNDQLYFIYNVNNEYKFYNITDAIKRDFISKDAVPRIAYEKGLLSDRPNQIEICKYFEISEDDYK